MSDPTDISLESNSALMSMGAVLLSAREQQNLSIDDICTRLRISPRQVRALEADDFSALPEATITRGFIRNYARLLGIDVDPLLQAYRTSVPTTAPPTLTLQSENILISGKERRPWLKYILASFFIALLVGAWQLYMDYIPKPAATEVSAKDAGAAKNTTSEADAGDAATTESLPMPALPAAERAPDESAPVVAETSLPSMGISASELPHQTASPEVAANQQSAQQSASGAKAMARLKLSVTGKSWVNVTDKDKKIIFDRIMPAGSEEVVEGLPPLAVIIGNAPASQLVFNGKPVDLAPYTKLDVARITLE
jgi:cytoskeleton protein RodZ